MRGSLTPDLHALGGLTGLTDCNHYDRMFQSGSVQAQANGLRSALGL